MSKQKRVTRPKLRRTEPIRNWTAPPKSTARPAAAPAGTAAGAPPGADESRQDTTATNPFGDVIARSVDLGYRVVDEYIRQGQRAAERLAGKGFAPEAWTSDTQDAALRMAQYASDFAGLWFDLLGVGRDRVGANTAAAPAGDGAPSPASATNAASPAADGATRARVEVASIHPVEVALDLRPTAARCRLAVEALRATDPALPALDSVAFVPSDDDAPPRLRLRVPADQPAGTYNALVTDEETNRPVGTLSVRVVRA